jgi:hypothetical protein
MLLSNKISQLASQKPVFGAQDFNLPFQSILLDLHFKNLSF